MLNNSNESAPHSSQCYLARDWSGEKPRRDAPGWYWWRWNRECAPMIVLFSGGMIHSVLATDGKLSAPVSEWTDGLWYGPLTVPVSREDVRETVARTDAVMDELKRTLDEWNPSEAR